MDISSSGDLPVLARRWNRRRLLQAGGATVLLAGTLATAGCSDPAPATTTYRSTVAEWRATRRAPYLIAHRGAGDLIPEHTLQGYEQALAWGADAVEISVIRSSDGVLFCQHDLTMNRTTALKGDATKYTAAEIAATPLTIPRLGPRWSGVDAPVVPRLDEVLARIGGRAVLCIEAKDQEAFDPMVALLTEHDLLDTVMLKIHGPSKRVERAHELGFPVFGYLGNTAEASATNIASLAGRLDRDNDVLVIPARGDDGLTSARTLSDAVATRMPIWVFPVHRRYEVDYFAEQGVEGIVAADLPYLSKSLETVAADEWAEGAIAPGELTKDPYNDLFGLQWPGDGEITIDFAKRPSFAMFAQFCPIPFGARSYTISFEAKFDKLPTDRTSHVSIAFGHEDDRNYIHQGAASNGYHALLRATGEMAIYSHVRGKSRGTLLSHQFRGPALKAGEWVELSVEVADERIYWSREGSGAVETRNLSWRGGYFHIGRSGLDGPLTLRNLRVTTQ